MTEKIAMSNAEIVKTVYERFRQGDVAGILAKCDSTIEFRLAEGHPYQPSGRAWIGKDAITQEFFAVAGPEWDGWSVAIEALIDNADVVVVEGRYRGVYKPTGNEMDVQVCHVWRLRSGRIVSFHQYLDTANLQRVMGRA
jgi:uncharacterized protein